MSAPPPSQTTDVYGYVYYLNGTPASNASVNITTPWGSWTNTTASNGSYYNSEILVNVNETIIVIVTSLDEVLNGSISHNVTYEENESKKVVMTDIIITEQVSPVINSVLLSKNIVKGGETVAVTVNATDNYDINLTVNLTINVTTTQLNQTGENIYFGMVNAPESSGIYTVTINATDSSGNSVLNTSENLTVDNDAPTIAINIQILMLIQAVQ